MNASDRLLLGFVLALGALAAVLVPQPGKVLFGCAGVGAAVLVAALVRGRSWAADLVHDFLPVPVLALLVNLCGPVVAHANPSRWDAALAAADVRFFGPLASAWMHAGGRPDWLTDAASLAYASYYLLPVLAAAGVWRRRQEEFDRLVFAMVVTLLASYVAYFIAPASGPRVAPEAARAVLGGGAASDALRAFLEHAERNQLDAFPSGHTAASLVLLAQVWPMFPRLRAAFAAAVGAIIFSTVYLSLHYVVDVAAGFVLAALVLAALPSVRAWMGLAPGPGLLRFSLRH